MSWRVRIQRAVQEGGTPHWVGGIIIKGCVELVAAIVVGRAAIEIFRRLFSLAAVHAYFGSSAFDVMWLASTIVIGLPLAGCTYITLSPRDE